MKKIKFILLLCSVLLISNAFAQNYTFNFYVNGQRVCLAECEVDLITPSVTIKLLDAASNSLKTTDIYRRHLYGTGADWLLVASALPAGTTEWTDTNVALGEVWEYKVRRNNTWTYNSQTYNATGYTVGSLLKDNSDYQGQMILLVADNIVSELSQKYERLKMELTGDGWFVNEVIVPKANTWDSGDTVVGIRSQISEIYNTAPENDKPKVLFILGHVPMPRSGSTSVTAPDGHDQNKGARGFDGYYADIDGVYTDDATFNPGGLQSDLAINYPGDFKWDQDFFTSDIEMAFGRVDFEDIDDYSDTEIQMIERYLDKLSNYKNVANGFEMGEKSGFYFGFNNSNDGSYRTLPNISKSENVYQNTAGAPHPQWVQNNGPLKIYMQNGSVPEITEWNTYGMDATVFTSDQSYFGYNDVPQNNYIYSRIRALLASDTKCLVTIWTTTGVNNFYQACMGEPFGFGIKEMMNHNSTNNNIEKAPQEWDTQDWWNRTHFGYNGDPTIRLYQVKPASDFVIQNMDGDASFSWTASLDTDILGYHIYKSDSEFGIYNRITTLPLNSANFVDLSYQQYDWYMLRPVKVIESGCGKFLQPGIGVFVQGDFLISSLPIKAQSNVSIFPNPANHNITVSADMEITKIQIISLDGKIITELNNLKTNTITLDVSDLNAGVYFLRMSYGEILVTNKIVVE